MVVRINDQKNVWGKTLEPNRSDLWQVDFTQVLAGLKTTSFPVHHYATAVILPRQAVKPQEVKEGGVPVLYPSWDEPLSEVKIDFVHDIGQSKTDVYASQVYAMLTEWHKRVRSGRPGGHALNANYKFDFAFDLTVKLLKGSGDVVGSLEIGEDPTYLFQDITALEVSAQYTLKNAWLSGFQISDLNYDKAGVVTINACLFAHSIV